MGGPWLDVPARLARALAAAELAAAEGADVLAFPETYLSGYPYWLSRTNGATFGDPRQKEAYAYYLDTAVEVGGPEVRQLAAAASDLRLTLVVGITERSYGSTYATVLTIGPDGVAGHHRKLVPTYDERLVWAPGDGAGLTTHPVGPGRIGSLNCWENWMPQARQAMYAAGEDVHIGVWPGSARLTGDITRFVALEGRVFSVAAGGLLRRDEVPDDFPLAAELRADADPMPFDGGSAVAGPDGEWVVPPVRGEEGLIVAALDLRQVRAERFTFDPAGHYSRPDVFGSTVDRRRRAAATFVDDD
ncbi:carbon-nitrogen hydrolase family protein [Actinoplanes sp. LDG1-06]|uniref:Carbon-nitrogen hydrolase family protein n=1 Tax=Paractinoplanes ovalisporus TaxID=2810368 RepID=A0ABS2ASG9_9ACTN|nr:carbon-nitrogen hydrolase family protein [Actinoplanes ovalisporus]